MCSYTLWWQEIDNSSRYRVVIPAAIQDNKVVIQEINKVVVIQEVSKVVILVADILDNNRRYKFY